MSSDAAVFVLEKLKLMALRDIEQRVEKYLMNEFKYKILPKVISEVKSKAIIDLVNLDDQLELTIKIKETEDE